MSNFPGNKMGPTPEDQERFLKENPPTMSDPTPPMTDEQLAELRREAKSMDFEAMSYSLLRRLEEIESLKRDLASAETARDEAKRDAAHLLGECHKRDAVVEAAKQLRSALATHMSRDGNFGTVRDEDEDACFSLRQALSALSPPITEQGNTPPEAAKGGEQ